VQSRKRGATRFYRGTTVHAVRTVRAVQAVPR
jgi:hypothetical protein